MAGTAVFAIWDDHDFGTNDCSGGPAVEKPAWKIPVWRLFRQNWVNPAYGGGAKQPGCWFRFSIADVDFFMTDGRCYRHRKGKTMLGPVQKRWLLDALAASKATFKVIASGTPFSAGTKGASRDTWDGFAEEREEIFSFLEKRRISGVILLAADRHRSDVWKTERAGGYPLYEFESSRLTNLHTHPTMKAALFSYNRKCSFGLLTFDTKRDDPTITYRIVNIDNQVVHTFEVPLSRISFKDAKTDRRPN